MASDAARMRGGTAVRDDQHAHGRRGRRGDGFHRADGAASPPRGSIRLDPWSRRHRGAGAGGRCPHRLHRRRRRHHRARPGRDRIFGGDGDLGGDGGATSSQVSSARWCSCAAARSTRGSPSRSASVRCPPRWLVRLQPRSHRPPVLELIIAVMTAGSGLDALLRGRRGEPGSATPRALPRAGWAGLGAAAGLVSSLTGTGGPARP